MSVSSWSLETGRMKLSDQEKEEGRMMERKSLAVITYPVWPVINSFNQDLVLQELFRLLRSQIVRGKEDMDAMQWHNLTLSTQKLATVTVSIFSPPYFFTCFPIRSIFIFLGSAGEPAKTLWKLDKRGKSGNISEFPAFCNCFCQAAEESNLPARMNQAMFAVELRSQITRSLLL